MIPTKEEFYRRIDIKATSEEVKQSSYLSTLAADMAGGDADDWQNIIRFYRIDCEKHNMINEFMKCTGQKLINIFSKVSSDLAKLTMNQNTEYEDLVLFALREAALTKNISL